MQLERREGKLHVVLQDSKIAASTARPNSPTPDKPSVPSSPPVLGVNEAQLQRMQAAMAQVLNQHIGARKVLKHLSYLEHALKRHGAQCFLDLPVEVLKSTLLQLASVMGPTPSQGLTEVHACLVVIVVDRDVDVSSGESSGRLSEFNVANKVQVCEISHSDFAKADPQWPLEEEVAC
ncbi:MAG: hypothetical protein H7225_17540 [Massilia sp.]|nr:hypothetical protein [Aquabacterium sp.]